MKGTARFLFGALLGAALGYAFALIANRGPRPQRTVRLAARRARRHRREAEATEEITAS